MVRFRFRYVVAGGHTHVRLFAGDPAVNIGLAKCGDLCFRNDEWEQFMRQFARSNVEFLPDQT